MKTTFRILCIVCSLVISLSLLSLSGGAVSVSSLRWPLFPNGYLSDSAYDQTVTSPPNQWSSGLLLYNGTRSGYNYSLPGYVNIDAFYDATGSPNLGPQIKYVFEFGKFGLNARGVYWICFLLPSYAADFHTSASASVLDSHIVTSPVGPTINKLGAFEKSFDAYNVQDPTLWYARKAPDTYEPYYSTVRGLYEWYAVEFSLEISSGYVNAAEIDVVFVFNIDLDMQTPSPDPPDLAYPDLQSDTWDNLLDGFFTSFKPIFDNPFFYTLGLLFATGCCAAIFTKLLL